MTPTEQTTTRHPSLDTRAGGGIHPRTHAWVAAVASEMHATQARAGGVATAVLSNIWGAGEVDPYAGYDLTDRFNAVVISDQVGLRKPDPAIYELTVRQLGVPAAECVFVDDTAHNLPAATALGMATVHFTDADAGVAEIRRLLDLPTA